ncbi:MAG: penicillin-binding protein activator [Pseudomonadota bacterium]
MAIIALRGRFVSFVDRARKAALGIIATGTLAACNVSAPVTSGGDGVAGSGATQVALLVPYGSSRATDAGLARSLENAARMAAADLQNAPVEITVYPTQGSAAGASAAANQAVAAGAQVILGPLYADNAAAAGVAAARSGVPVLSFSNNTAVAGGNVWVLGNTFENTANRLLSYAAGQGRNRILVTRNNQGTGDVALQAIRQAAGGTRAQITGDVAYDLSQQGILDAVPSIVEQVRSSGSNGVFLTGDTAGDLPVIAQLLSEAGLGDEESRFLGLTRWDIPAEALQLPGLQGGYFALPDPGRSTQFRARYQSTYGASPHPLAGIAYDGMAAIGAIAAQDQTIGRSSLTRSAGFAGTGGVFRLRGDGTVQRALAVAQVVNRTAQVVSPAPSTFGGAGF